MLEVNIGFVENDDLARLHSRTQSSHAPTVVMAGFFDDSKTGQKSLEVQSQMQLGRSLAATGFAQSIQLATKAIVEESTA